MSQSQLSSWICTLNWIHKVDNRLKLYDGYGFEVIAVRLWDSMRFVDKKGDRTDLSANASTRCSQSDYEELATWDLQVGWHIRREDILSREDR